MIYVTYNGVRRRDPERVARVVTEDGTSFHVIRMASCAEATKVVSHMGGVIHKRRDEAICDATRRADAYFEASETPEDVSPLPACNRRARTLDPVGGCAVP